MIDRLFPAGTERPRPGDVLEGDPYDRLVATPAHGSRRRLITRAEERGLEGADFRIVKLRGTVFTGSRYVGVRTVESREEASLLKVFDGKIAVRFQGEYRTLEMNLARFEQRPDRHLIRRSDGQLAGVYHGEDHRFLERPGNGSTGGNRLPPGDEERSISVSGEPRDPDEIA